VKRVTKHFSPVGQSVLGGGREQTFHVLGGGGLAAVAAAAATGVLLATGLVSSVKRSARLVARSVERPARLVPRSVERPAAVPLHLHASQIIKLKKKIYNSSPG
jgi:hypothetical protein